MPRVGRPGVFSTDIEKKIASYIHILEKCGYPLTKKEIIAMISEYIRRNGIGTPFRNDVPGKEWFLAFRKRHKLSYKKPQSVKIARKRACNPFVIYEYFDLLEKVTRELELGNKPEQIYNLDETSFCSDPSKSKIVGLTGFQSTRTTSGPARENTTVLLAANAIGGKIPPLVIFQGKYLWNEWMYQNENIKTAYAVSQKGCMETTIFEKYLKDLFISAVGDKRPVLLIYDGHSTHVDLNVIELAATNGITIIKLPPPPFFAYTATPRL
ncbi:unnamed protein product [Parnassius apollo]|uniref:(apollo) hypothetical protein n=1 Tax=Parnassius apollo TaxID=110799 RepID=A0A8S3WGY1_PARAO|nr:unnamed protein product [Parnassius apollo]